jgi:hypothetical protein
VPSAGIRFAAEAAFLVLVALGLGLARFDPIVIAVVMLVAWVLVALLERASAKEAARVSTAADEEALSLPPPHVERIDVDPAQPPVGEPDPKAEPEPTVSERSARAILASAPPPLPAEKPKAPTKPSPPRAAPAPPPPPPPPPEPEPEPEPVPVFSGPPREWNLWELQRAARDAADDDRHEEWGALLIHLREFANADGDLPLEFDGLVRESFAPLLARTHEAAAAP